ncbi:MAG: leucine-rich repeat domain-containing protein, partial [Thermoplasmatales archaeon]|nr:leucine-rich repeat domain-containing protein [Thermoplasmatales archaeon]
MLKHPAAVATAFFFVAIACLVLGGVAADDVSAESHDDGTYTFELHADKTATVTGLLDSVADVNDPVIPGSFSVGAETYTVTAIGGGAFLKFNTLRLKGTLTIPSSVKTIESQAFMSNSNLNGLVLQHGLVTIGDQAFSGCSSLAGYPSFPGSLKTIGDQAFYQCIGYTGNLTIPSSVDSIGERAFSGCGFTGNLDIGGPITVISEGAFQNCKFTGGLTIPATVVTIAKDAFSGCAFSGALTIPANVETIGPSAFYECDKFTGDLVIPDTVTTLGSGAFQKCAGFAGSLTISNALTAIEVSTFWECSGLTGGLTIPNSVTSIGPSAFRECTGLNGTLKMSENVQTVGELAFYNSNLSGTLSMPRVTSVGPSAFSGLIGLTGDLSLPSVTSIGNSAFSGCTGLTGLSIPIVQIIGENAFNGCSNLAGTLSIPSSVVSVGKYAFSGCKNVTQLSLGHGILPAAWGHESLDFNTASYEMKYPVVCLYRDEPPENTHSPETVFFYTGKVTAVADPAEGGTFEGVTTYRIGADATVTAVPARGYEFTQWSDGDTEPSRTFTVTEEAYTFTAEFSALPSFAITWSVDGETTVETYYQGETPTFKGSTDKPPTPQTTYTFSGWDPGTVPVTEDATYTAQYDQFVNEYTVTWSVDGAETTEAYPYGATPEFK